MLGSGRADGQDTRRVLVLHPFDDALPSSRIVTDTARSFLTERAPGRIEFYSDYLDLSRFPSLEHRERAAQYLETKHGRQDLDVVLALGPDSLSFILDYGSRIAPGVPVVFCAVSSETVQSMDPPAEVAGVVNDYNLLATLALARRLQPAARDVFIVTGAGEFDRAWEEKARRELAHLGTELDVTYLAGLPFDDLLERLASVDRNAVVILLTIFEDGAGQPFIPRDTVADIAHASAAPVYGPYDTFLGLGIVGGHMDTFEETGRAVGELALKILSGEQPGSFDMRATVPQVDRVDARQLDRWGIAEGLVPDDAIVLFREPSLWERHPGTLLGIAGAFALQTTVVLVLLAQMRRRRRAEESLKESEERMAFAASSVNIGMWHADLPDGEFWATEHTRSMFGLAEGEPATAASFVARIHPDDRAAAAEVLEPSSQSRDAEFRILGAGGAVRWIALRSHLQSDESGNPRRLTGSFADVTPRKAAEQEADRQRAELAHLTRVSMLGQLCGAIAHELNQPLTAILANAQAAQDLLRKDNPDRAELDGALADIVSEDRRAGEVIRRLVGLLRKKEGRAEPVDLNDVVGSTLKLLNSELVARRIAVRTSLHGDLPNVLVDPVQIQQVLINLILNAIDAVGSLPAARRAIAVSTSLRRTGAVEVAVQDSGEGLSPEHAARASDPFFTTKPHGLGLGLSICSTIVGRHGGSLTLANGEGGGARASFVLPAHEIAVAAQ